MFTLANFAALALAASITAQDPFQAPNDRSPSCGSIRPLSSIRGIPGFSDVNPPDPWYSITDDVVMEYWESRDEVVWWTPLCSFRSDVDATEMRS